MHIRHNNIIIWGRTRRGVVGVFGGANHVDDRWLLHTSLDYTAASFRARNKCANYGQHATLTCKANVRKHIV